MSGKNPCEPLSSIWSTWTEEKEDEDNEGAEGSSSGGDGFGLGAMLLTAGISALAGALVGIFTEVSSVGAEESTQPQLVAQRFVPVQPPSECSICFEPLGAAQMEQLPCSHLFHQNCLMKWLTVHGQPNCPICRLELTQAQIEIYLQRNTEHKDSQ